MARAEEDLLVFDPAGPAAQVGADVGDGHEVLPIVRQHVGRNLLLLHDPAGLALDFGLKKGGDA